MKKEKMLFALGEIDDRFVSEAGENQRRMPNFRVIAVAACLVVMVGLTVLMTGILGGSGDNIATPDGGDQGAGTGASLTAVIKNYLFSLNEPSSDITIDGGSLPEGGDDSDANTGSGSSGSNGNYLEVTDNQISGIIEGDLVKATEKYIFRFSKMKLHIYSMAGEESKLVSLTELPIPDDMSSSRYNSSSADMYLSDDGNTATIFFSYVATDYAMRCGVLSIDVSDVNAPKITRTLTFDGNMKLTRKIGNKLYLITGWSFRKNRIDLDDPASYLPGIDDEDGRHICDSERVVYPCEIDQVSYRYLTVFDEGSLDLVEELAVMGVYNDTYFADGHIIMANEYYDSEIDNTESVASLRTKMHVIKYTDGLNYVGEVDFEGEINDQYSVDIKDGHLRIVVTLMNIKYYRLSADNASLYVYSLSDMSRVCAVERFAPDGEGVTAARFEGDKLYVCTAVVIKYIDPVYIFDLSDYENIKVADTGYINGFSSSLIDLGDGYLLGVGRLDSWTAKLEVYRQEGDSVVSVATETYYGGLVSNYKTFLINREENIFGFCMGGLIVGGLDYVPSQSYYIIVQFDGEGFTELCRFDVSAWNYGQVRAIYHNGYFYISLPEKLMLARAEVK